MTSHRILLILSAGFLFFSCTREIETPDPPDPNLSENARTNNWIYDQLARVYYWAPELAGRAETDLEQDPQAYLESVLYHDDRFSYIEPLDAASRAPADGMVTDFGINYMVWKIGSARYELQITSVVPGSPAERAGLKRSHLIGRIDGEEIPSSGWDALFDPQQITLTYAQSTDGFATATIREVELTKAPYYDTPVMLDTVYTVGTKTVGYLAYNKFYSAFEDDNDVDLLAAFRRFKQAGVSELILDLRFNGGGLEALFVKMSSLIAPAVNVGRGDVLAIRTSRVDRKTAAGTDRFSLTPDELATANLNLSRLFVLANSNTASASELTMHCLRQYIPVIHYGETTVGKYVGSYPIPGEDDDVPWTLHPITMRLYDKRFLDDPGYPTGLSPDVLMLGNGLPGPAELNNGYFRGQFGEWDPGKDYDPMLHRVMTYLQGTTRSDAFGTAPVEAAPVTPRARMIPTGNYELRITSEASNH
jgi:C-terminal processing protease CtpA/Prc